VHRDTEILRRLLAAGAVAALLGTVLGAYGSIGRAPDLTPILVSSPRVVVLKSKRLLHLFDGDRLVRSYPIDLGVSPQEDKRLAADGRTPEGLFRIVTKNPRSPFHRFLGLDYPDLDAVEHGLTSRLITFGEAAAILRARGAGVCPDWSTVLGGGIGIHGRRRGWDWTAGCIALADRHVDELFGILRLGDPVEILP